MSPTRRKAVLGWSAALALFLALLGVIGNFWFGFLPVQPFDSAVWKEQPKAETRVQMVSLMLLTHRLDGMTRAEIDNLLGPPTDTTYFRDHWEWVQYLGPERGFMGIDSEWLVIDFSPDGRVARWDVITD